MPQRLIFGAFNGSIPHIDGKFTVKKIYCTVFCPENG